MKFRQQFNLMIFMVTSALTVFLVYGAFIGAERAKLFFNSDLMTIFWCVLFAMLVTGFAVYISLRKRSGLLLIHAGCILILAGGMYGSEKGHLLAGRFLKQQFFTKGMLSLHEGEIADQVALESGPHTAQLPFSIRLKDAFIEYYDKPQIIFYPNENESYPIPVEVGKVYRLPNEQGTVALNATYQNFKMIKQDGRMEPYDSPDPGFNPAYQLTYTPKDGTPQSFFVFERFGMHPIPGQTFRAQFVPPQMVRDYKSTLQVVEKQKVVKETTIEVNRPLYYRGYHFYQSTFGYDNLGPLSGIMVTSARGVWIVFSGYGIVFIGLIWHFRTKFLRNRETTARGTNGD